MTNQKNNDIKKNNVARLFQIRKRSQRKKFVKKDSHKRGCVPSKWRKPRGRHSAIRQQHRGRPKLVSIGYGSPRQVRFLHFSGLQKVLVQNQKQLEALNPLTQGLLLSHQLGLKKKIKLIGLALEKKLVILNLKNPAQYLAELQASLQEKKESKKKKLSEKEKKELEKKKKAEEKEKEELKEKNKEEKTEEEKVSEQKEKKDEEKKEIEKTLIKKQ